MNHLSNSYDWRKEAFAAIKAAAMTATNDRDIEKAFSDQAAGFVENKVGDLMKEQYRIGFEIVKKNDENTRMVGIFAFKVDKNLLFAPVFFINGEIKGPLLYRCDTKAFVPANKEWASYLIESLEDDEGHGRDQGRRSDSPPLVQMHRIAFLPPSMMKGAAADDGGTLEVGNKPAVIRHFNLKPTDEQGVYEVTTDTDSKDGNVGNTSGCSAFCIHTEDDGTVRVEHGEGKDFLTAKQAADIEAGKPTEVYIGDGTYKLSAEVAGEIKRAFLENVPDLTDAWEASFRKLASEWEGSSKGLLREMLEEPDYGRKAANIVLEAARGSEKVASMLYARYRDGLMPEQFYKSAEAEDKGLSIAYDPELLEKASETVKKNYFLDGFFILDKRPEESMSVVYQESPVAISTPQCPGIYSVVSDGGDFVHDVFVCPAYTGRVCSPRKSTGRWGRSEPVSSADIFDEENRQEMFCFKDGKSTVSDSIMGIQKGPLDVVPSDKLEVHKAYVAIVGGYAVGPISIGSIERDGDVLYCKGWCHNSQYDGIDLSYIGTGKNDEFIVNSGVEKSDVENGLFGADTKFVKLDTEVKHEYGDGSFDQKWDNNDITLKPKELTGIGRYDSVDKFVFETWKMPHVGIKKRVVNGRDKYAFCLGDKESAPMHKACALVKLTRDMGIGADKAYELMGKAVSTGACDFFIEKEASRLHVVDQPDFTEDFDTEFGVPLQPAREYKLRVQGDQEFERPSAIGDAMDPTSPTGLPDLTVATTAPEDLQSLADTMSLPHVFEHGVVGTLADTFNAMSLMTKYIPRIEDGVDSLGRIKFLIHWCPNDFERSYGEDDMANLEAEVDANFTSQGALLLNLLKKADKLKRGDGTNDESKKDNE